VLRLISRCWNWLRGAGHWSDLTSREWQGYGLWIPTTLFIAAVEILGALGASWIPWTTISTTVGHLETRWHLVALAIVVLITLVVFLGIAYNAPKAPADARVSVTAFSWGALSYDVCVLVIAVGAGTLAYLAGEPKLVRGYWIYGLFIILGIVGPSIYAVVTKTETTFFATIRSLGSRLPWFRFALAAGMAVLVIHLAIYPWPDITHQSTKISGIDSDHAKAIAAKTLRSENGFYETVARGSLRQTDAWIVTLYPIHQQGSACIVAVISKTKTATLQTCVGTP
jgi:hypothetical protein